MDTTMNHITDAYLELLQSIISTHYSNIAIFKLIVKHRKMSLGNSNYMLMCFKNNLDYDFFFV